MNSHKENGGALIAVALFFATIGILFGLGRLKSYEYQVGRRIERQYQVEKMLTARSAFTLIKCECAPDGSDLGFPSYSNLLFKSQNSDETLGCRVIPTPVVDRQEMKAEDFKFNDPVSGVWDKYDTNGVTVTAGVKPSDATITRVEFSKKNPATNTVYKCAIFKKVERFWLESDFGYMYRIHVQEAGTGFDKMRLYLVGAGNNTSDDFITERNYLGRIQSLPSIMMELSGTTNLSVRTLRINNGFGQIRYADEPFLSGDKQKADKLTHGGGFLLSGKYMVGFGEGPPPNDRGHSKEYADLHFSDERVDLSQVMDISAFSNSWIVVENEFVTNQSASLFFASVDSFVMREPTTYTLSVHNEKKNAGESGAELNSWVFQTEYPILGTTKFGKQCILDTFGGEVSSLRRDRN